MNIDIKNGDCLELLKTIPDKSIDLILTDPPYGVIKGLLIDGWKNKTTNWDVVIDTEKLFEQFNRILKANGYAILFSKEPYTSHLRSFKQENIKFLYPMIWLKQHFSNPFLCKSAPCSYFEDVSVFIKEYDLDLNSPLRLYFKEVLETKGLTKSSINKFFGHTKYDHTFRVASTQFELCNEHLYNELVKILELDKLSFYKPYSELLKLKKEKVFNLNGAKHISNVLQFNRESKRFHPTQKPVALLEYLIKTYSNENETVLDFTMGSGSTGVACVKTNRNFIGFELDSKYYEIAKQRIDEQLTSVKTDDTIKENDLNEW